MSARISRLVTKPDCRFSPCDGTLLTVFVCDGKLSLAPKKTSPHVEEANIDVVEHDVLGIGIPLVNVE